MHTQVHIHFHTSHISHIRVNTRHELLTADFASPHTAAAPYTLADLRPTTCISGMASVPDNTTKVSPACAHTLSAARQMGHFAAVCGTLHLHTARQRLAPVHQSHPPQSAHPMTELQAAHQLPGRSHTASEAQNRLRGDCQPPFLQRHTAHRTQTHQCGTEAAHHSAPAPTPQPIPPQTLSGEVSVVPRAPVAPGR